eukprot:6889027-Prymnesium_polylepis.1
MAGDSFHELALTSLQVVRFREQLAKESSVPIDHFPLGEILAASKELTVADMVAQAASRDDAAVGASLPPLTRRVDAARLRSSPHPVSWNQSQLLTVHAADPGSAAHNVPMALWLHGPLEARVLRASLEEVVRRHAVLRTTYE